MKRFSSYAKRSLSMILVLGLLLSNMSGFALLASAADPAAVVTDGELVVLNYAVSNAEAELLNSKLLAGDTHSYTVPTSNDLLAVDAIAKTVKADSYNGGNGYVWNPVSAALYDSENVKREDIALTDGEGAYTFDENAFSIQVTYSLGIDVSTDTQTTLFSTAGWLQQGVANMDAAVALNDNYGAVVQALPVLKFLADGISVPLFGGTMEIGLGADGVAAYNACLAQSTANGGKLNVEIDNAAYKAGDSKTQFLLENGAEYKSELLSTCNYLSTLKNDPIMNNQILDAFLSSKNEVAGDPLEGYYTLWTALKNILSSTVASLETILAADWTAAEKGTALVKDGITPAEYVTLDVLVAAIDDVTALPELSETLYVEDATITYLASMVDVVLTAEIEYYDDGVLSYAEKTGSVKLPEGATEDDAAAKIGAIEDALLELAEELGLDLDAHFGRTVYCEMDVTSPYYTVSYAPKTYTVTYDYKGTDAIAYGAEITLPVHTDDAKAYDYSVNGAYAAQGSVITILGATNITRTEGKAYTFGKLMTIIADSYPISEKAKAILKSGALFGDEEVNVRYPAPDTDSGLVSATNGVLTANPYPSSYENLEWMPYRYVVDGEEFFFNGATNATITKVDYQSIEVYYRLSLTNIDDAQDYLDLVKTLADEADGQRSALATLTGKTVSDNLATLNGTTWTIIGALIGDNTLDPYDADKNAALKTLFQGVVDEIKAKCLEDGELRLGKLINDYKDSGYDLSYYYLNNVQFRYELSLLRDALNKLLTDDAELTADEKLAALTLLIGKAPSNLISNPEEYTEKVVNLQTTLDSVYNGLVAPNAAIDLDSPNLTNLTDALCEKGTIAAVVASDYPYLDAKNAFALAGSGKAVFKVTITVGEMEDFVTAVYTIGDNLTSDDITTLMNLVTAKLGELTGNANWYKSAEYDDGAELKALIGKPVTESTIFSYTWVEKTECEKFGHKEETIEGYDSSCTEPGLTDGVKCSVCKEILTEQENIPVKPHTEETIEGYDSSCTKPGLTDGVKCSVCKKILTAQEEIPMKPHTEEAIEGYDSSCTKTGLTDGVKCSVCKKILTAQEEIPMKDHDFTGEYKKDDSGHWHECTLGCGTTDGAKRPHTYANNDCTIADICTECELPKEAGRHNWGAWEITDTEHKRTCISCQTPEVNVHVGETIKGYDSTCSATGLTDGSKCSVCGTTLVAQIVIEKKPHTEKPIIGYGATCKLPGLTDGVECSVCHEVLVEQEEIPVKDHTYDTYTYDLNYHWQMCIFNCGTSTAKEEHEWDNGVINTAAGTKTFSCFCGATKVIEVGALENGLPVKVVTSLSGNNILLPEPAVDEYEGGYKYNYTFYSTASGAPVAIATRTVNNKNGQGRFNLTAAQLNDYNNGLIYVEKVLVNINNEKLELLADKMGSAATLVKDTENFTRVQDGYYTGLTVNADMKSMVSVLVALVANSGYSSVSLGGSPILSDAGKISLADLVRTMFGSDDRYTSKEIIDLCNGTSAVLIDTEMLLGALPRRSVSASAEYHLIDFKLALTSLPDKLASAGEMLGEVEKWVTFEIVDGQPDNDLKVNAYIDLPEKVYEIYVAALRFTDSLEENDVNAVETQVAYAFLKDFVDVMLGAEVSTTTLVNTAKKLGYTLDIEKYENYFQKVKGQLYGNVTYDADGVWASVSATNVQISKALDAIEGMLNTGMMDTAKSLIAECEGYKEENGSGTTTMSILIQAMLDTPKDEDNDGYFDTDYEAIVVDASALKKPGKLDKLEALDFTENLAARLASLNGKSAVMLQDNITADLVFNGTTVLDLNGKTIDGNIIVNGKLIIVDSVMDTLECGEVTGTITGSDVTILGGKYTADVSAYLKESYVQIGGVVQNEWFTVSVDDATGDITYNLNSELMLLTDAPSIKAIGLDLALDLALNHFTSASVAFDNNTIFTASFEDLIDLYTSDDKIDSLLSTVDMDALEVFVNAVFADLLDFGAIETAMIAGDPIFSYAVTTKPWQIKLAVADDNSLTAGLVPNVTAGKEKNFNVHAVIVGDNEDEVLALVSEAAEIATVTATVTLDDFVVKNKNVSLAADCVVTADVNLTTDENYPIVLGVLLANANPALKADLVTALNSGDAEELKAVMDTVSMAEFIAAVKAVNKTTDFAAIVSSLGLTIPATDAVALEEVYHIVLAAASKALTLKDIAGGSVTLGDKETSVPGTYAIDNFNLNYSGTYAVTGGYSGSYALTSDLSLTVELFSYCDHTWDDAVFTWESDYSAATASITCSKCGKDVSGVCTVTSVTTPATSCDVTGVVTYTAKITLRGTEYTDVKTGNDGTYGTHVWGDWVKTSSTKHKRVCLTNDKHTETESHNFENNVCIDCGYKKSSGTVIIIPGNTKPSVKPDVVCRCRQFNDIYLLAWYHEYVCYAIDRGLMQGVGDNLFAPNMDTTRAMIVTLFYRLEKSPAVNFKQVYTDVPNGEWYSASVAWATENGIVLGYGDGTFKPNDVITREQIAAIFHRYAAYKGYDVSERADLSKCSDTKNVSAWAVDNVRWAVGAGMMVGTCTDQTTLAPQDNTTRAQLATLLKRLCVKYGI